MESSSLRLGLVQDTGSYRGIPLELDAETTPV